MGIAGAAPKLGLRYEPYEIALGLSEGCGMFGLPTTRGHLMARCEDYPCCGHTDGLGCNYVPDMDYYYARAARMAYDDYYYDEG